MHRPTYRGAGRPALSRRDWLRLAASGVAASTTSGWFGALADESAGDPRRRRSCILLWMAGGPSQLDTLDPKPGTPNGGPIQAIESSVPGLRIGQHLPKLARQMGDLALIRSMSTKEGDHGRATFHLRTGYAPTGPIRYPSLGSLVAREFEGPDDQLPNFVSIAPLRTFNQAAFGPGFLGPQYAPLIVGERAASPAGRAGGPRVEDMDAPPGVDLRRADDRLALLDGLEADFLADHPGGSALGHQTAYRRAVRMVRSEAARAFDLESEPAALRDAYGRNEFGQGCLLARRLVERGVPFVEVTLSRAPNGQGLGWDSHQRNFDAVKQLCEVLDPAWSTLIEDLRARGRLDSTLIVWMGEFGRTPKINPSGGRDHFPGAWSTALAGGGIRGGQALGRTTADGSAVEDRPVSVGDFMATICTALGIDPRKQNDSDVGRPIRIADPQARPIREILA